MASEIIKTKKVISEFETTIVTKSGEKRDISWYSSNLTDENGKPVGSVATGIDITKRKKAEAKILEAQKQLKALALQLTLAEERERKHLAEQLHDGVSQSLVFSKLKLDALSQSSASPEVKQEIKSVSELLSKAINDTRFLTFELSFPVLYELGFKAAIATLLNENIRKQHGIDTEFETDGTEKYLDGDIQILLFRSIRELLINVVRHSKAKKVKVVIEKYHDKIQIIIKDNGIGFNYNEVKARADTSSFGLFSIHERIEYLNGTFDIQSAHGKGCKVTITAPLKTAKAAR